MSTSDNQPRSPWLTALLVVGIVLVSIAAFRLKPALAASCVPPATDYGTVSNLTLGVSSSGTYRLWTRMAASDSVNNSVMVEVDGANCYTVGGANVPIYDSTTATSFSSGSSNWIGTTTSGTAVNVSLTSGSHTVKIIGVAPGVAVDRLLLASGACVPSGSGDNCGGTVDTIPPLAAISQPANNASVSGNVSVTATASDDIAVSKVELYVDGVVSSTDTTSPYTFNLNTAQLATGSHNLTVKAYDTGGNTTTSSPVAITVTGGVTYLPADINMDGTVNIQDFGLLKTKFGQTGSGLGRTDINQDGVVNIQDFGLLKNTFGQHI